MIRCNEIRWFKWSQSIDLSRTLFMQMKFKSITILIPLILIMFFLSGCAASGAGSASGWPGLSVDKDTAYFAYNKEVYAINISDGSQKWQFPAKDAKSKATFFNTPALTTDGQLLVGGYDTALYSLNSQSGQVLWTYPALNPQTGEPDFPSPPKTDRYVGSTLVGEHGIFAPNANNYLYAFDSKGNLLWSYQTGGPLWARPISDPDCSCIYISSMDHKLYSIDAQTGKANWSTNDLGGSLVGSPALSSDGVLFVGTFGSNVLAINAETGKILWQKNISSLQAPPSVGQGSTSFWVWGGPTIKGNRLYFGVQGGYFFTLDTTNGNVIGTPFKADGAITDSPLVTDDAIYFGTDARSLYSLDLDGNVRSGWPKNITSKIYTTPAISGDMILIVTTDAKQLLVAMDTNGTQKWVFPPPTAATPTGSK